MYEKYYTGIEDVHGRKIHEGDKVRFKVFDGLAEIEGEAKVYFSKGCFRLNVHHPLIDYVNNGQVTILS